MREIKFRGYDKEDNCFVYGWLTRLPSGARKYLAIVADVGGTLTSYYIHNQETVGQYTGLKDKNGVEIYEGDFVFYKESSESGLAKVEWASGGFRFNWISQETESPSLWTNASYMGYANSLEIKGNIHENPELLEPVSQ